MILLSAAAAIIGVASHVLYFNRGEHHMWAPTYIQLFTASVIGSIVILTKLCDFTVPAACIATFNIAASYLFGAYTSLLIYRVWLSPLNKFPGPWQAKISAIWLTSQLVKMDCYVTFEDLHKKYGKYVRIGPNDLSITDAELHEAAFGPNTKFRKSQWYDNSRPFDSMHTTRDKALHDRRRRFWAPAFSDKALREYEPKVKIFNDKLVERIKEHGTGPINFSKWINLYSFDVMGRLAFGKDYGMLDSGERHWALDLLVEGMEATPPRLPTWCFRVLIGIPFAAQGLFKFLKFCRDELEWRVNSKEEGSDITGWLLKGYQGIPNPADDPMFQGDGRLIVVAGSDTTAATMAFLFYELARKPEEAQKIRAELRPLTKGDWSDIDIRNAPHLNGAINEALRLHPPVPSGWERMVPDGGAQIGDVFLPEKTQFWMPQYVIGRGERRQDIGSHRFLTDCVVDEDNYENALEFVPERWYSKPNMIKHKNAFAPFSLGSEGCIGKNRKSTPASPLSVSREVASQMRIHY